MPFSSWTRSWAWQNSSWALRQVAVAERRERAADVAVEAVVGHDDDLRAGCGVEPPVVNRSRSDWLVVMECLLPYGRGASSTVRKGSFRPATGRESAIAWRGCLAHHELLLFAVAAWLDSQSPWFCSDDSNVCTAVHWRRMLASRATRRLSNRSICSVNVLMRESYVVFDAVSVPLLADPGDRERHQAGGDARLVGDVRERAVDSFGDIDPEAARQ